MTGTNGAGKTSLLEAIGYLSLQRSFRRSPREALVRRGTDAAVLRALLVTDGREVLVEIEMRPPGRDRAQVNRQRVSRRRQLLDELVVTVFAPDDLVLVKGGPEERRDYLDDLLELVDPRAESVRAGFERILRQRNILLRQSGGHPDASALATLDVWDTQLVEYGTELAAGRRRLTSQLAPPAADAFRRLTGLTGSLTLTYQSSCADDFAVSLAAARPDDIKRSVTTLGPHRDELEVGWEGMDARTRLSQGRQRAVTLALRLAGHELVTLAHGRAPLLLLDDAFSELDEATADALAGELPDGQSILTTARGIPESIPSRSVQRLEDGRISA